MVDGGEFGLAVMYRPLQGEVGGLHNVQEVLAPQPLKLHQSLVLHVMLHHLDAVGHELSIGHSVRGGRYEEHHHGTQVSFNTRRSHTLKYIYAVPNRLSQQLFS